MKKWTYQRVEVDCCRLHNCTGSIYQDELCRHHYNQRERLPKRKEISEGEREWYAEQGRALDETALIARRMPIDGPLPWI